MNIDVLINYIAVCENGSINKAAKELNLSQPPLTKQMQSLEKEVGAKLFDRSRSGIKMTKEGELLYKGGKSLIAYHNLLLKEIKISNYLIRFGMTTSSVRYASSILKAIKFESSTSFDIHEKNTFELLDELKNDIIDFAFIRTPFQTTSMFECYKLSDDKLVVGGRKEYFKDIDKITVEWLSKMPLIANRRWKDYLTFEENGLRTLPNYTFLCDDNRTAYTLAKEGLGIAILPSSEVIDFNVEGVETKEIEGTPFLTSIYLVYKKDKVFDPITQKIITYIKNKAI